MEDQLVLERLKDLFMAELRRSDRDESVFLTTVQFVLSYKGSIKVTLQDLNDVLQISTQRYRCVQGLANERAGLSSKAVIRSVLNSCKAHA